jgi:hypothetical protein
MQLPVVPEQVWNVVQSFQVQNWLTSSAILPVFGQFSVTLANTFAANLSALQALFDQYRINAVEVTIVPSQNLSGGAATYTTNPNLFTVLDFDDGTSLGSVANAQGYATCIESEPYEKARRCFRPRIQMVTGTSASLQGAANVVAPWLDCAYSGTVHYGMKAVCDLDGNLASGYHATWDLRARVHASFRSAH